MVKIIYFDQKTILFWIKWNDSILDELAGTNKFEGHDSFYI